MSRYDDSDLALVRARRSEIKELLKQLDIEDKALEAAEQTIERLKGDHNDTAND